VAAASNSISFFQSKHAEEIRRCFQKRLEEASELITYFTRFTPKSIIHHNQTMKLTTWFLNLPLDESINNKSIKFEVQIQDPMKHS
jgi:hypothetical protein